MHGHGCSRANKHARLRLDEAVAAVAEHDLRDARLLLLQRHLVQHGAPSAHEALYSQQQRCREFVVEKCKPLAAVTSVERFSLD